jgi:hypothetical protein
MAVMAREAWTDERLDDFKENVNQRFDDVDKRFDRVDADIRELRVEVRSHRNESKASFERVDDEFSVLRAETNARFDALQRTMLVGIFAVLASIWASVIGAVLAVLL